ncbi:MAG: ClpXP protease specificity-enhancing factor SspB [Alphaproteobacteria bacterium]|nr:ClpXP protease specificity-enhancing factor SspB [Alphaproteobacteria bacterium]
MPHFDYEAIVQKALRGAVQESLTEVQNNGFSASHHFYITFQTNRADVKMPDFLREKHPEEITIVLQHQFWDLKVTGTGFSVSLSFNDKHETLVVPYTAIISFLDPSVKFGLQFVPDEVPLLSDNADGSSDVKTENEAPSATTGGDNVITMDTFRKK